MKKLYEFNWDCGRQGAVSSVFIAEESVIAENIGKNVYFGEILGKHSEVDGTLDYEDLTIKSDDQELIKKLESIFPGGTLSGYNPLEYIDAEE